MKYFSVSFKTYLKDNGKFYFKLTSILLLILAPFIIFNDRLYVITSPSMAPTLNIGDLVIRGDKLPEDINVGEEDGDILIFKAKYFYEEGFDPDFWGDLDEDTPIIHRAIDRKKINGDWYFKTRGDNNHVADGGYKFVNKSEDYDYIIVEYNDSNVIYISERAIDGIVILVIPYVGYVKIFFHVILAIFIIIIILYLFLKLNKYEIKILKISEKKEND